MNATCENTTAMLATLHDGSSTAANGEQLAAHGPECRATKLSTSAALRSTDLHSVRTSRQANHNGAANENVADARTGSEDAVAERDRRQRFEELVAVHLDDLYRFAYWLCGNRTAADDVVQEVLMRAWKSIERLKDPKAAKGWLLTIVRRENARHFGRTQLPQVDRPDDELVAHRTEYDTSTEAFVLRRALQRLPTEYREPLLMQVVYGYSQKEIAAHLGISNAGAGSRLYRAREKMRGLL